MDVKETIKGMMNSVGKNVEDNKSTILTTVGVVGVLATVYTTVVSTKQAQQIIEKNGGVVTKDVVKDIAKAYIKTAASAAVTIGCIVTSHKVEVDKFNTLEAMYLANSAPVKNLAGEAMKAVGIKQEEPKTEEKKPEAKPMVTGNTISSRFFCEFADIYVDTTYQDIVNALIKLNEEITNMGEASFEFFLNELGADYSRTCDEFYWDKSDGPVYVNFGAMMDGNMELHPTIEFDRLPEVKKF